MMIKPNPMELLNLQETLRYLLNTLVNLSAFKRTREKLKCDPLMDSIINTIYKNNLSVESQLSLVNIMFNLNFSLKGAPKLPESFLRILYNSFKDDAVVKSPTGKAEKTARKIIAIVASASSLEENHLCIIKSNFYK
jgi:hypothetical protein